MRKKVLITGSTGFIGFNITKLLIEKDEYELILFTRNKKPFPESHNLRYFFGDINNYESVVNAVKGCDIVIHTAGLFTFDVRLKKEIYKTNVDGTENICKAILEYPVERLIYTSSAATIGKAKVGLSDETTKFNLWSISSHYKKSKVLAEKIVTEYYNKFKIPVIILNPSLPLGAFDFRPTSTGFMVKNFLDKKSIFYIDGGFNFVYIRDVAYAHVKAINKGETGERYIIGGSNLTLKKFYKELSKSKDTKMYKIPYIFALLFSHIISLISYLSNKEPNVTPKGVMLSNKKMFYDNSKSVKELEMNYTPIHIAIEESINWFKNEKNGNI